MPRPETYPAPALVEELRERLCRPLRSLFMFTRSMFATPDQQEQHRILSGSASPGVHGRAATDPGRWRS